MEGTIRELCEAHPEACEALQDLDYATAGALIGSLATIPDLHANTLRIEILGHLAAAQCRGEHLATTDDLKRWIEVLMASSPLVPLEDSPEDAFIGYVCSDYGGWRTFDGVFANGYFWLERLIGFLSEKTDFPNCSESLKRVVHLMRLGDAVANRLGLERYMPGGGQAAGAVVIPEEATLESHLAAIVFSNEELEGLDIDLSALEGFVLSDAVRQSLVAEKLWGSSIERYPLLRSGDNIIVATPSFLCRAAMRSVMEGVGSSMGGWGDTFFGIESAEFFINSVIRRLKIQPIEVNAPPPPDSLPPLFPYFGQFDYGKTIVALTFCSQLSDSASLDDPDSLEESQVADFEDYLGGCCDALSKVEGFSGGMILVGVSSVGQGASIGFNRMPENWHFFGAGLGEWRALLDDAGFDAHRLWRLGEQLEYAQGAGIEFSNLSGLLNLYAYWKSNEYSIIPLQVDVREGLHRLGISMDFSRDVRVDLHRVADRHCRLTHDGSRWARLRRVAKGLNPDYSAENIYGDEALAGEGELLGCVDGGDATWWVSCPGRPENGAARDLQYQLWECVLNWLHRAAPVFDRKIGAVRRDSVLVEVLLPGVSEWGWSAASSLVGADPVDSLQVAVSKGDGHAVITVREEFLAEFHQPENLAERKLVGLLASAALELIGETQERVQIEELVEEITKGMDARFFHVVNAPTLETVLAEPGRPSPTFIPPEAVSQAQIGLADLVGRPEGGRIEGRDEATKFLTKAVEMIWERIEGRIRPLSINSIASRCFSQIDEISRDKSRWKLSTRALIALEGNAPWLQHELRARLNDLSSAEISNRLIIETATYAASDSEKRPISLAEHAVVIAEMSVLLILANHRDAVAGGFMEPRITIFPNGAIDIDQTFYEEVFSPYLGSHLDDSIGLAASSYEDFFQPRDDRGSGAEDKPSTEVGHFERAFRAEFGFNLNVMGKLVEMFDEMALESGQAGGVVDATILRAMLRKKCGVSGEQAAALVERFTLPIRKGWNRDLPKGLKQEDVFPWGHRRGLSVLQRPLVQISKAPRTLSVSAPHIHRWVGYLMSGLVEGHFPERQFRSSAMKKYIGKIAGTKGHQFASEVAETLKGFGFECDLEVKMTALGAPKQPDLGDIDVLAWDAATAVVLLIECKRLRASLTMRDVIQRLEEFKGEGKDRLAKHTRRVQWIEGNLGGLSTRIEIESAKIRCVPLLVTNSRVPMSFVDGIDFSADHVIAIQGLEEWLGSIA